MMKEFSIPYSDWDKIPFLGEAGIVGFSDIYRALAYQREMEKREYEKIKSGAKGGGEQKITFE